MTVQRFLRFPNFTVCFTYSFPNCVAFLHYIAFCYKAMLSSYLMVYDFFIRDFSIYHVDCINLSCIWWWGKMRPSPFLFAVTLRKGISCLINFPGCYSHNSNNFVFVSFILSRFSIAIQYHLSRICWLHSSLCSFTLNISSSYFSI